MLMACSQLMNSQSPSEAIIMNLSSRVIPLSTCGDLVCNYFGLGSYSDRASN